VADTIGSLGARELKKERRKKKRKEKKGKKNHDWHGVVANDGSEVRGNFVQRLKIVKTFVKSGTRKFVSTQIRVRQKLSQICLILDHGEPQARYSRRKRRPHSEKQLKTP
jgi:hypothetical protein